MAIYPAAILSVAGLKRCAPVRRQALQECQLITRQGRQARKTAGLPVLLPFMPWFFSLVLQRRIAILLQEISCYDFLCNSIDRLLIHNYQLLHEISLIEISCRYYNNTHQRF